MSAKKDLSIDNAETIQLHRHARLQWTKVESGLASNPTKMTSLWEMERTPIMASADFVVSWLSGDVNTLGPSTGNVLNIFLLHESNLCESR